MIAALRRALPSPYALHLVGLAVGLAALLVAATALAPTLRLGVLALALAGAAGLLPVAQAAAQAPGAPRVRVRLDVPPGSRPVRLGLRRPARAAAVPGWRPSAWDPREVAPWSPDADRRDADRRA